MPQSRFFVPPPWLLVSPTGVVHHVRDVPALLALADGDEELERKDVQKLVGLLDVKGFRLAATFEKKHRATSPPTSNRAKTSVDRSGCQRPCSSILQPNILFKTRPETVNGKTMKASAKKQFAKVRDKDHEA